MLAWCTILFILGLLAFSDTIFNYGDIFRKVNSVIFMLISLGLLIRTSMKMRMKRTENLISRVDDLENKITAMTRSQPQREYNRNRR